MTGPCRHEVAARTRGRACMGRVPRGGGGDESSPTIPTIKPALSVDGCSGIMDDDSADDTSTDYARAPSASGSKGGDDICDDSDDDSDVAARIRHLEQLCS